MPINDPIRGKKVAPKSLAFEGGRTARSIGATSYQTSQVTQQTIINNYYADPREAKHLDEAQARTIWDAERRAKHQTAQFGDVTNWCISATQTITLGDWDKIPFNQEILRVQGARCDSTGWWHKLVKGDAGVWWYYAHIAINIPATANATGAKLGIWRNSTLYYVVDQIDAEYAGETPLRDVILRGGVHLNLDRGDEIDFRIYVDIPGAPSSGAFFAPSSLGGYVTGHRVKCNQTAEGATTTLDGYVFV